MAEGFLGEIKLFGGTFTPRNWTFCFGQTVPIADNQALYSLLGTQFGGDGRNTFGIPDCRSRLVLGPGQGPGLSRYFVGQEGGFEFNILDVSQLPPHNHQAAATAVATAALGCNSGAPEDTNSPVDAYEQLNPQSDAYSETANAQMGAAPLNVNVQVTTELTGGGNRVTNIQPFVAIHYIICISGVYPSRS